MTFPISPHFANDLCTVQEPEGKLDSSQPPLGGPTKSPAESFFSCDVFLDRSPFRGMHPLYNSSFCLSASFSPVLFIKRGQRERREARK